MTKQQKSTLIVLMLGAFLSVLNQTLINPALPSIMLETGVSATTAQWLVSGFTLVNAIVIAISAFLMDRFSTRKLFISIFVLFFAGSLLASWGANFAMLLIGRILQAICAGVMLPMSMTVLLLLFPHEKRGSAMGLYNLVLMFAPAIGPVISGILTDKIGWHVMFLIMAALAAVVILVAAVAMKNFGETKKVSLDKWSVTLSSLGLFCLLYGFSLFGHTMTMPAAVALIVVGAIVLFVFARRQLRLEQPFLQIRVLWDKRFLAGITISMLIQASLAAAGITLPIYIQTVRGLSATISGTVIMPGAILGAAFGYFAGKLHDRFGARYVAITGVFLVTLGSVGMVLFDFHTSVVFMIVSYAVRSVGLMLANTPINTWSISTLSDKVLHHGNAVSSTLRQVAATLCTAIMVSAMSLVSAFSTSQGELRSQMAGIRITYCLSVAIGLVALFIVIVKVKDGKNAIVTPENTSFELDIAMKDDPYTVSRYDTLEQVVEKFIDYRTSGLPVVDGEKRIVGFISDGDVLRYMAKQDVHFGAGSYSLFLPDTESFTAKAKNLLQMNVMEIASRHIITAPRSTPLLEVCRLISERKLNKLPVTQDGVLIGTVSRGDIMRELMKRLPLGEDKL
ncbi:DHA2 family efflux MFS transporter permease subunit [Clostridium kluyveri]|uniref:Transporter n=1 Tax=Clostridium kluyveri TaxID=1534 RepID=A0A1L5FE67_CLOKL|nr:DHA2 family efflux MFS transporter permease subunit [Clostridium kluyveri]APM41301.1 transporter [Clostridium kluyveri]